MNGNNQRILAVIIAHNEIEYVKLNVSILSEELKGTDSEIVVVDNYSDDGLREWLTAQEKASYIICDDKLEGFGEILKVVVEQFADGRDLLLLRANYFLAPGSVGAMEEVLHSREKIAAAGPMGNALSGRQKCFPGNNYAEAGAYCRRLQREKAAKLSETSYIDINAMLLGAETAGEIATDFAIPQAVLRGYMGKMLRQGKRFAIASQAVCFTVGEAKDEPYRAFAPGLYRQEKLCQMRRAFGDITYRGIHLYKYLEPDILVGINRANQLQNVTRSKITLTWASDEVALSSEDDARETEKTIRSLPQRDVLFVTLPIRRAHQGKHVHTVMETYMASLDESLYLDLECVEDLQEDKGKDIPTKNRYPFLESAIPRIYGTGEADRKELLDFLWINFIHPLETLLEIRFDDDILRGCCLKAIYLLKMRGGYVDFYKDVIARVNPKVIIYSHGQDMILTCLRDASLEAGIPTLEISHGIKTEGAYHPHLAYADYVVAYSDVVADKSRELGNDRVLGIGKPGINMQPVGQREQLSVTIISFISSLENEIFSYAQNLANRLDKSKYLVVYKFHNSELWGKEEIAKIEQETGNLKFMAGKADIRDLIGKSDIVVGIRSSGIFDALPYPGVKVIAVRDRAVNLSEAKPDGILQEAALRGDIVMAEDEDRLYQEVVNYTGGGIYREAKNCFWPQDAAERFRALVGSYLHPGILAVITAHNEIEAVKVNVRILLQELKGTASEIVVVDNYSNDGLREWLTGQADISYVISDERPEGFGSILKTVNEQFADGRDLLLLRANSLLTPGSIAALQSALHSGRDIAAAGPVGNALPGEQKCCPGDTYAEAAEFQKTQEDATVRTAYLDPDIMLVKGSVRDSLDVDCAVPQAAMREFMRRVIHEGLCLAVAGKAVCFADTETKDEPYQTLDTEVYMNEKLHQLFYSFGDISYHGIYLYKYLESAILEYLNSWKKQRGVGKLAVHSWPADKVFLSAEEEAEETRNLLDCLPRRDILIVTLFIRRPYKGFLTHTTLENFISSLPEDKYIDLEWYVKVNKEFLQKVPTKNLYPITKSTVPRIYGVRQDVDKTELVNFICEKFLAPLEQLLGVQFDTQISTSICLKASYILKERESYMQFYREAIARIQPKVIMYSHGQDMALTYLRDVAMELGIPTLEIAHGTNRENTYHKQLAYADHLAVYSDIIAAQSREQGNDRVIGIGKPGVYEGVSMEEWKYPVVVISFVSSTEQEIFSYACNLAARLAHEQCLVVYKAHITELKDDTQMQQIAQELGNLQIVGGEVDIRDIAAISDIVVGIQSSAIYDVLPWPMLKVIAVKNKAKNVSETRTDDVLEEVAANGDLIMVADEEQLYREVANYQRGTRYRGDVNSFWPKDAKERFLALVERYLQENDNDTRRS